MPIRAVACDLDGTLLRSDGTLDPRTRAALGMLPAAGILLVICTARPARWLRPLVEAIGHGGVAVCANGAIVWDLLNGVALDARLLQPRAAAEVVARLGPRLPGAAWAVEWVDGYGREPGYVSRWPTPAGTIVDEIQALLTEPLAKLMLRHDRLGADALVTVARQLVDGLAEPSHSNSADGLLELSAAGVSKASALARLCAQRGIDSAEVVAFGDMPNDLPMLRWAGHAVAVANAHPDVLVTADEITASNDAAGVAIVLERMLAGAGDGAGTGPRVEL